MKKEISDLSARMAKEFAALRADPVVIQRIQNQSKRKNPDLKPSRKEKATLKVKKEKQERLPAWGSFKKTWDMLYNQDSPDYLDKDLKFLVAFKSHLIEPYRTPVLPSLPSETEYHPAYILFYLKIQSNQYETDRETRERVDEINIKVSIALTRLKAKLEVGIPWILNKYPQAKIWFNDIFGNSAWYYGTPQSRKSKNPPHYEKSYDLFVRHLNGETYKQLGFTKDTWRNFTKRGRVQGALCLLHKVHRLLYSKTEASTEIISYQKNKIEKMLTPLPQFIRRKVLKELHAKEFNQ